ncbi:hypothetical protein Q6348_06690 [Isoptericola sp. b441]|uniref:Heavy metal transporter n=1 Tax=Actinotalea lenta TaxID=3064654 RepID=A0ABT9D9T3_9CELL|nr:MULTISPECIES: hypothetical protein [unclassified Isoptericola]MDO8106883.1 hypothetical protein [Isoptericola sp. b441]MDO8121407.1 hypothetical protein [Isoptericola sp. b490]
MRRRRHLAAVAVLLGVLAAATTGVVTWLRAHDVAPEVQRCAAALDGTPWSLTPEQADSAALLAGTALRRGLPARAVTIAIATALQESGLRNLDHGDLDSLGLFQQRPSQGWGTPEQVLDPVHATNAFYDALVRVPGYRDLPITQAAQAVQRSAFPQAYAQHEAGSRAWASALTGYTPGAVTCTLPSPAPADPAAALARVNRDLGVPATAADGLVALDASALPDGTAHPARLGWAVGQWAVAAAQALRVTEVRVGDRVWTRTAGSWSPAAHAVAAGRVELVLAG